MCGADMTFDSDGVRASLPPSTCYQGAAPCHDRRGAAVPCAGRGCKALLCLEVISAVYDCIQAVS